MFQVLRLGRRWKNRSDVYSCIRLLKRLIDKREGLDFKSATTDWTSYSGSDYQSVWFSAVEFCNYLLK